MAFRADLRPFLAEFIEHHRGLRIGRVFGLPAGYAGRRMFVCLLDDGLIVKLPERMAKDEVRGGNAREASRLAPILEVAARFVTEAA